MPVISGTVFDDTGNPVAGRIVRAYRRDTGELLVETLTSDGTTPLPLGKYIITTAYTGECNVICLDDSEGTTYNDLILRATPS